MKEHELSKTERLVVKQAGFTTFPLREQAKQLFQQANMHEVNVAVDILEALDLEGVVKELKRDKSGLITAIIYDDLPEQPDQDDGQNGNGNQEKLPDKPGPRPARSKKRSKKRS